MDGVIGYVIVGVAASGSFLLTAGAITFASGRLREALKNTGEKVDTVGTALEIVRKENAAEHSEIRKENAAEHKELKTGVGECKTDIAAIYAYRNGRRNRRKPTSTKP